MKNAEVFGASGSQTLSFQRRQHLRVVGWEIHLRVFPFDIDKDCCHPCFLELMDEARNGSGFAAACRSHDPHVSREDRFFVGRDTDDDLFLTNNHAYASVTTNFQHTGRLGSIKRKDRTVGPWSVARRDHLAVDLFAQDLYVSATVVAWQKYSALHGCGYDDRRVRPEAIGFCERPCYDRPYIGAIRSAIILETVDPDERLRGKLIHVLFRQ